MITGDDIENLASLARITVTEEEKDVLAHDLESILGYVSDVQDAVSSTDTKEKKAGKLRNVMREDRSAHEKGIHTEALLREVPQREGNYVKVKKILP